VLDLSSTIEFGGKRQESRDGATELHKRKLLPMKRTHNDKTDMFREKRSGGLVRYLWLCRKSYVCCPIRKVVLHLEVRSRQGDLQQVRASHNTPYPDEDERRSLLEGTGS
jgi:hypothetical protein